MKYPPRPGDLPPHEIMAMAQLLLDQSVMDGNDNVDIYFRFTCQYCGTRCNFNEKNKLFEEGECCACGKVTIVERAGFSVHIHLKGKEQC